MAALSPRARGGGFFAALAWSAWFLSAAHGQGATISTASDGSSKYQPIVRALHASVIRNGRPLPDVQTSYCLYFPSRDPNASDESAFGFRDLALVHVAPQVASRMTLNARKHWYACYFEDAGGAGGGGFLPLLDTDVWKSLPAVLRHIVAALGIDDAELVLISDHLDSGSISIYFRPDHDQDLDYYQKKLAILLAYIGTHDMDQEIPLVEVLGPGGYV